MKHLFMWFSLFVLNMAVAYAAKEKSPATLEGLQVEYETTPMGLDVEQPRFGWRMKAPEGKRGYRQTAYRIVVASERGERVWDSGWVRDDRSQNIAYGGNPLRPSTRYTWMLEVSDQEGERATAASWFETGLMGETDTSPCWSGARWIGVDGEDLTLYAPYLPVFRLDCLLRLDEESGSRVAGFVYGLNDPRLADANRNIYGLAAPKDSACIRVTIDTTPTDTLGRACLRIYRTGYHPDDRADRALAVFPVPDSLLNGGNLHAPHRVQLACCLGVTQIGLDGVTLGETNLNPLGAGGDFVAFPVLADVGICLPAGQAVSEAEMTVANYRSPQNTLATLRFGALKAEADTPLLRTATPRGGASPLLRTTFGLRGGLVRKARLYVSARGIYQLYLNGRRVGDDYFNPGATQYNRTHLYQTYDVTRYLLSGEANALGAVLAEGWWSGGATYTGDNWNFFGDRQSLLAKLVVTYADGSEQVVVSDPQTWRYCADGPWRYGSFFQGEVYDARREPSVEGWTEAAYDARRWKPAREVPLHGTVSRASAPNVPPVDDYSAYRLTGQYGPTVREVRRLTARSVSEVRPGVYVYDMGQNMAGVPHIRFTNLKEGTEVRMRYAEMTYPDLPRYAGQAGLIMQENIRAAMAQDIYIARGGGEETFAPRFTLHGYRYVEVTGIDRPLPVEDVQGVVLSSVHTLTAAYESSNGRVNRLWQNIVWSMLANFISIPTDCPQRNERLGWAGDISVFSRTATYLGSVGPFLRRYLQSMRDVQRADGRFADIAPLGGGFGGLLWGSAGITVAWECYRQYGDRALLAEHYEAMRRYLLYVVRHTIDPATNLIVQDRAWGDLGDWLGLEDGRNDKSLLWEAYLVYDLDLMQAMADVLGKKEDAQWMRELRDARRDFFRKTYLDAETGTTVASAFVSAREGKAVDTQTSYVLPLAFGIADSLLRPKLAGRLLATLQRENRTDGGIVCPPYSLMTGFIGTAWIGKALSDAGHTDAAYRLLQQTAYPSWLYPVEQGATTIWERLNSYTHTNGFGGNNRMNSFNHYSFGAVGAWLCGHSLGIESDETQPGFKRFWLKPEPDPTGQMTFARGHYDSPYGRIESGWTVEKRRIRYTFAVPANTTALLVLPAASSWDVHVNGRSLRRPMRHVKLLEHGDGWLLISLQSGEYEFEVRRR